MQGLPSPIYASNRPYSRCQILKPSLVFLNRASYGRRPNNDVTSQEREATMIRHDLHTGAQICGKSATQASLFVRHGRGVNRVYRLPYLVTIVTNMQMSWNLRLFSIRPLFFYFLVYGFLGRKNGSVGRGKKIQIIKYTGTSFLQVYTVIKVVTQNFSNRYLNKQQRKYLEEFLPDFVLSNWNKPSRNRAGNPAFWLISRIFARTSRISDFISK